MADVVAKGFLPPRHGLMYSICHLIYEGLGVREIVSSVAGCMNSNFPSKVNEVNELVIGSYKV